jgi:hypothetical protein
MTHHNESIVLCFNANESNRRYGGLEFTKYVMGFMKTRPKPLYVYCYILSLEKNQKMSWTGGMKNEEILRRFKEEINILRAIKRRAN